MDCTHYNFLCDLVLFCPSLPATHGLQPDMPGLRTEHQMKSASGPHLSVPDPDALLHCIT